MTRDARWLALTAAREGMSAALLCRQAGGAEWTLFLPSSAEKQKDESSRAQSLLEQIQKVLLASGDATLSSLNGIAFESGPGGFTALRTVCAVVQGLAYAAGCPVMSVGTLEGLAWQRLGEVRKVLAESRHSDVGRHWLRKALVPVGAGAHYRVLVAEVATLGDVFLAICEMAVVPASSSRALPQDFMGHFCAARFVLTRNWGPVLSPRSCAIEVLKSAVGEMREELSMPWYEAGNAWSDGVLRETWQKSVGVPLMADTDGESTLCASTVAIFGAARQGNDPLTALPCYVREKVALDREEQEKLREARREASSS